MSKHRQADSTELVRAVFDAVLSGGAESTPEIRSQVAGLAEAVAVAPQGDVQRLAAGVAPALPPAVVELTGNVVRRPIQADLRAHVQAGASEDEVFEWVVSAAVGAGRARLERGLAALASQAKRS